jgi:SAM-dependent methyltransferase
MPASTSAPKPYLPVENCVSMQKEWFATWFDSPYYHTLYQKRDEREAQRALDNLLRALQLPASAHILDLACGRGRHARYLAEQGFDVTGLDISQKSIAFARQFEHERLSFYQHDMRRAFRSNYYDAVMNMFTSFGYFDTDADHLRVLKNVAQGLRPGGKLLLDYFNSAWVRQHLVPSNVQTIGGIDFHLRRYIRQDRVFKEISFEAEGRSFQFLESVRLFQLLDFQELFRTAGLEIVEKFGDYDLSPFEAADSTRLILIAQKTETDRDERPF